MTTTLLIPGLLCDRFVWEPFLARWTGPTAVADLSRQAHLTRMAEDCLADCPGPLHLVGHSMGARVALEMVRLAPERVQRLALLDTGMHPLRPGEVEKRAEIVAFARAQGMAALADRWLPGMVAPAHQADSALMQALRAMVCRADPELHARQIQALVDRPDASQTIGAVRCPTLLLVGAEDQWSPVSQHEAMAALIPGAQLLVIPRAGHFSLVEQPEAVAQALVDFLSVR